MTRLSPFQTRSGSFISWTISIEEGGYSWRRRPRPCGSTWRARCRPPRVWRCLWPPSVRCPSGHLHVCTFSPSPLGAQTVRNLAAERLLGWFSTGFLPSSPSLAPCLGRAGKATFRLLDTWSIVHYSSDDRGDPAHTGWGVGVLRADPSTCQWHCVPESQRRLWGPRPRLCWRLPSSLTCGGRVSCGRVPGTAGPARPLPGTLLGVLLPTTFHTRLLHESRGARLVGGCTLGLQRRSPRSANAHRADEDSKARWPR